MKEKIRKLRNRGNIGRNKRRIQEEISQLQNVNFQIERPHSVQHNGLKQIHKRHVTEKCQNMGHKEDPKWFQRELNMFNTKKKRQESEWHQTSTATLAERRQRKNSF